jgi:xanthine dehydrogenase small subunit
MAALDADYSPIGDMRASKEYRQSTTRNLLYRFWLESSGYEGETNVYNYSR